jgi:hypothetical protein
MLEGAGGIMTTGPHTAQTTLAKAARLAVLLALDDAGLLEGRSLQDIADALHQDNYRSTISRDLRLLPQVRRIRNQAIQRLRR